MGQFDSAELEGIFINWLGGLGEFGAVCLTRVARLRLKWSGDKTGFVGNRVMRLGNGGWGGLRGGADDKDSVRWVRFDKFFDGRFEGVEGVRLAGEGCGFGAVVLAEFAGFAEGGDEVGVVAAEALDAAVQVEEGAIRVGGFEGGGELERGGRFCSGGGEFVDDVGPGDLEAFHIPFDFDHFFDEAEFGGVLGEEIVDVLVVEDFEAAVAFAVDDHAVDEAFEGDVFEFAGVLGGDGFALGGAGAGGELGVFDIGLALAAGG